MIIFFPTETLITTETLTNTEDVSLSSGKELLKTSLSHNCQVLVSPCTASCFPVLICS